MNADLTAPGQLAVTLPSGTLTLTVERTRVPVDDLLTYAIRQNPRRGFLFVSRVLGKHIPIPPNVAQHAWHALVAGMPPLERPHFIGLAETATALGEGVARAWAQRHPGQVMTFQHSTRYVMDAPLLLRFDEPHSHAPAHLLYDPGEAARSAHELVLIDDEISTGTTLENLARAWITLHPHVTRVVLVSLTDWCPRRAGLVAALDVPVEFVSLLRGAYAFTPRPDWTPPALPAVTGNGADKTALVARRSARLGHAVEIDPELVEELATECGARSQRVLVLGTGEYQFPPAQLALALQQRGYDVRWSATTRSPILPGLAIQAALTFRDNVQDSIPNYVYNVNPAEYDVILVAYEGTCEPDVALLAQLGPAARAVRLT